MATATGKSPMTRRFERQIAAVAAGADSDTPIGVMPFDGTVTLVQYIPVAAITGAATNNRTHTLYNRGDDNSGTTVMAQLNYASGVNAADNVPRSITLSATEANRDFAEGDVLTFESLHINTGIADPGGLVIVEVSRA